MADADTAPAPVVRSGAATDVGRVRDHNEDSYLDVPGVWVVADGLGGHAAGEVASRLAVDVVRGLADTAPAGPEEVVACVREANARIVAAQEEHPEQSGMGTTLTGVVLTTDSRLVVVNVGDSRVYRVADGAAEQLTRDHSEVQELVEAGLLDPADIPNHPLRHVITRSLGIASDVDPDTWVRPLVAGERFVVCSDGLTGELDDATVARLVSAADEPQAAADALVRAAVEAGGRDNVTVVVLAVDAA
jgi:serine/threonine protein phosphatase PrpC